MKMYDEIAKIEAPVASPSSPSATLTPFDALTMISVTQMAKAIPPRTTPKTARLSQWMSRTAEIIDDAGVSPFASGKFRASAANPPGRPG